MRKMEAMIPYWMARCPNYGWKESQEFFKAWGGARFRQIFFEICLVWREREISRNLQ